MIRSGVHILLEIKCIFQYFDYLQCTHHEKTGKKGLSHQCPLIFYAQCANSMIWLQKAENININVII